MGVRGLTAFIDRCSSAWDVQAVKPVTPEEVKAGKARVIKLVVDGMAMLYHLYFTNNFNCVCGGQYAQFAEHVRAYVVGLQKCGFSLFVVMDGTENPAKLATMINRENDKIKTIKQLTTADKYSGKKQLPLLARVAFLEALEKLGVKVAFADREADVVAAAMSKMHACCALSQDSDFFVYDLPAGYIPITNLEVARNGAVSAKRYNKAKFCADLGVKPGTFPLLASVMGNDYVPQSLLRPFHVSLGEEDVKMPAGWQDNGKEVTIRDQLLVKIAGFLVKHTSQKEAVDAICTAADTQYKADLEAGLVPMVKGEDGEEKPEEFSKAALEEAINTSLAQYTLNPKDATAVGPTTELKTDAPAGLPEKLVTLYRDGKLDWQLLNVMVNKSFWCHTQVEDLERDSAWEVGRELRQKAYKIMLEGKGPVTEYVRKGLKFETEAVEAASDALPGIGALIADKGGDQAARAKLLYAAVGAAAAGVEEDMQLLTACVRYWISAMKEVTAAEVAALCASMLQKKEDQTTRVSKEARPPWLSVTMAWRLAGLQSILSSALLLNQALLAPVKPFSVGTAYDGEFIHRFHHLQHRAKGVTALSDQLRKDSIDSTAFFALYKAIVAGLEELVKGEVMPNLEGDSIMWGASGPEGKIEVDKIEAEKKAAEAKAQPKMGGNFGGLLDPEEEEEDDDEEEEEEATPPPAPAPASATENEGKKKKKTKEEDDAELARLMAEMEQVDAKRQEQKKKEKERKKKK